MTALGVIILLIIVATGVAFFIASNRYIKSYEKLEYENCSLDEETIKQVEAEKEQYALTYTAMTITTTVLCIISAIPILYSAFFTQHLSGNQVDSLMTDLVAITLILIATALYLGYSFITENWEHSWIVWPISRIAYGIIEKLFSLKNNDIAPD